jgi:branched-chain amino acid transport system permease protein
VVIRPLLDAPRITLLVATVGVALFIIALTLIINGATTQSLAPAITDPIDPKTHFATPFYFFGAGVTRQQLLVLGVLLLLAVVLGYFFSRTNTGLAIHAISQDKTATQVVGISVPRTSQIIWGMAALLGGIAGILQAGVTSAFYPGFMTLTTLIPAFTAAVVGGMTSLPGAFIGGVLVGVVQNVFGTYFLGQKIGVPGNGTSLSVFLLLLLVLLIRPTGLLGKEA